MLVHGLAGQLLLGTISLSTWRVSKFLADAGSQIDYVPTYADNSVFVCTGGSGHGAKFMPVLGEASHRSRDILMGQWLTLHQHAADIFDHGDESTSPMRPFWRWREDVPRRNGLQDGPGASRNMGRSEKKESSTVVNVNLQRP